jgi:hypothetical protein
MGQVSQTTRIMKEEQGWIKKLVSNWEVKQKVLEEELSFVDDLITFGLEEYPHESYFDTVRIIELIY